MLEPKETDFIPQTLGEHIRKRRLGLGLAQKEVAEQLGCSWSAVMAFLGYDPFPQPASMPEQLAALRRKKGWTLSQAARRLGVDPGTWGRWQRTGIPWGRHRVIAAAFIQAQTGYQPGINHDQGG